MFVIKQGIDGFFYMVFPSSYEAVMYATTHKLRLYCFGAYENACRVSETLGL